jgi:hypothetical protein
MRERGITPSKLLIPTVQHFRKMVFPNPVFKKPMFTVFTG